MFRWAIAYITLAGLSAPAHADLVLKCKQANKPQDRINACTSLIAQEGDNGANLSSALYHRALAHYYAKTYVSTLADLTRLLAIKPDHVKALDQRGVTYRKIGEADKAIADHSKAISFSPGYARAYRNRGNAFFFKGQTQRAIADYSRAIELKPDYANAINERGAAYENLRDFRKAVQDYSRLVELLPKNADAYNNRGYAFHQLGDRARAIADYQQALRLNPALVQPRENLKALGIGS